MVWYGVVWYGVVWFGMVWCGMVSCGLVWFWYGVVWYGMVWFGIVWFGMVWYGIIWYGLTSHLTLWVILETIFPANHLTGAKNTAFLMNHSAGTSKTKCNYNQVTTQVTTQKPNPTNSLTYIKLNLAKLKPGSGRGFPPSGWETYQAYATTPGVRVAQTRQESQSIDRQTQKNMIPWIC